MAADERSEGNIRNGLRFFDRTDDFTASKVAIAAREGDEETLRALLADGAPCDVTDNRGWFPVHEAADKGHSICLQVLLDHKSDDLLNSRTYCGETPIFLATLKGHIDCVKLLMAFGAQVNVMNDEEVDLLVAAVKGGNKECFEIFLSQNFDVNSQDVGGWGAMHEAAYAGRQDFIERLLSCSADIDIQNSDGATPLFTAAQYGRLTCLKLLLKKGADVNKLTVDNASPLFIAAQEGLADCVTALLSSGSDPGISVIDGATALHVAAERGHHHCVQILLNAGASARAETTAEKITPLHLSSQEGHYKCMEMLLNAGASVDAPTVNANMTPICLACQGYVDCTKLLLDRGANPNHVYEDVDVLPKTPLMVAVESDCADCAKILAERGADTNMSTYTSPLILAAQNSSCECCKILLDFGADPNFSDRGKNTALSIAVTRFCYGHSHKTQKAQLDCIKLLLKLGASVDKLHEGACVAFRDPIAMKVQSPDLFTLLLEFEGNRPGTREMCRANSRAKKTNLGWRRLVRVTNSPRSLQHLCRLVIRNRIDSFRIQRIPELPVPPSLKQFLMYSNL
ncbi:PREDICTED: ankyrin repeat and SOCS box protein 3-like [Acropora digitifera]|uniref:ankyrin repeat and SOCS box protein 3-like n=1 Tax=Acropora digitifera TaxID=70779 RepID=UPI00077A41C6|nr:PREDICTED: ankyrin repeat and SOCS box protein 3-like [Acropora digitifera]